MSDIDLKTFSKVRPLTVEDLKRFSAADLDPHTVQVGQILCRDFHFSSQGQRSLSESFERLPANLWGQSDFEIGFGTNHPIHTILKSDEGFNLAAVVGALTEYWTEDFVVEFFAQLSLRSDLPVGWRPLESQWRRMVSVLSGVLATSSFGTVLTSGESACLTGDHSNAEVQVQQVLDALDHLNKSKARSHLKLQANGEAAMWLAAASQWLYGRKAAIVSQSRILCATGATDTTDAEVIIDLVEKTAEESMTYLSLSEKPITGRYVLGGRLTLDHFFRSCFGQAFTSISDDLLAAMILASSNIVTHRLDEVQPDWAYSILSQASDSGGQTVSLADTLTAWFPELRRLAPRFRKHSKLDYDQSRQLFDSTYAEMVRASPCKYCQGPRKELEDHPDPANCSIIVAEFIVRISFILARMVLAPGLLPKRQGVLSLLRKDREEYLRFRHTSVQTSLSEGFVGHVAELFNSQVEMLKAATILFTNSTSPEIDRQTDLMGITHCGLTIFSTSAIDKIGGIRKAYKSAIQVSPGWLCLFGHVAMLEVYESVPGGITFSDLPSLREADGDIGKARQLMKVRAHPPESPTYGELISRHLCSYDSPLS